MNDAGTFPAGQLRREGEVRLPRSHYFGGADDDLIHIGHLNAGCRGQACGFLAQPCDDRPGRAAWGPRGGLTHDVSFEIAQRRSQPFPADVDAHHPSGAGVDVIQLRGRPRQSAGASDPDQDSRLNELIEHVRHGGFGQSRPANDIGSSNGTAAVDEIERRTQVDGSHQAGLGGIHQWHTISGLRLKLVNELLYGRCTRVRHGVDGISRRACGAAAASPPGT